MHPADLDVARGVARVLGELAWSRRLHDPAAHPAREADPLAVDVGAGLAQQPERLRVVPELDPDLLEDRVGVVLEDGETLVAQDLERCERAGQVRDMLDVRGQAQGLPGGASPTPTSLRVVHQPSSLLPIAIARRRLRSLRGSVPACPGSA